jgi:hypothetical protein
VVAGLPHEEWVLTEKRLRAAIDDIEQTQERSR